MKREQVSLTLEVVIDVHAGAGDRHAGRRCAGGSRGSGLGDLGTRVSEEAPEIRGELEIEIPSSYINNSFSSTGWAEAWDGPRSRGPELVPCWAPFAMAELLQSHHE